MRYKVRQLEGALLNAAVAMAVGFDFQRRELGVWDGEPAYPPRMYLVQHKEDRAQDLGCFYFWPNGKYMHDEAPVWDETFPNFAGDWAKAGPVWENTVRGSIRAGTKRQPELCWAWATSGRFGVGIPPTMTGTTTTEAMMRAVVYWKFGDYVEIDL